MSDACARALTWVTGVALFIGYAGISVMPVLLRATAADLRLRIHCVRAGRHRRAGPVAIGPCNLPRLEMRPQETAVPRRSFGKRFWFAAAAIALALTWLAWSFGVICSSSRSITRWSGRGGSPGSRSSSIRCSASPLARGAAPAAMWIPLAQRSIRVAAILAIAILFAELWLVENSR
jgi:hypothetical protein